MNKVRASVAMAVYNGEKYIREQIDSILERMADCDELVISCDRSTDGTREIVDGYSARDSRVRVIDNPGKPGVQNNFTNAVMNCRGKYIFLADQDDVWIGDKINVIVNKFEETGADLVVHDGYMVDGKLNTLPGTVFERYGKYDNPIRNIIKCNYWGCCMAFASHVRDYVCPFPAEGKVGHDLWLGVLVGFCGKIIRVNECLIMHRLHGNNVSTDKRRALPVIIKHRAWLIRYLLAKRWQMLWRR